MNNHISNGLKKFLLGLILCLALPTSSLAALTLPVRPPLQTIPGSSAPNISNNVNSGDSSFNESQKQILGQMPEENIPEPTPDEPPAAATPSSLAGVGASPAFYIVLIFVATFALLIVFAWLIIRYRKK